MQRKSSAVWQGDLKSGKGSISTDSGTLKSTQYSFSTRFENGVGTKSRRTTCGRARWLLHHGAFRANSAARESPQRGLRPPVRVTLEKVGEGFSITKSHLDLVANIPGAGQSQVRCRREGRGNRLAPSPSSTRRKSR